MKKCLERNIKWQTASLAASSSVEAREQYGFAPPPGRFVFHPFCYAILFLSLFFISLQGYARTTAIEQPPESVESWATYEDFIRRTELENDKIAWSYIVSGSLVTIGSLIGANSTEDPAMQVILGLSSGAGLAGVSYGLIRLNDQTSYSSLFAILMKSSMTPQEKAVFMTEFIRIEREKEQYRQRVKLVTHLVAAGLNLYAAAGTSDPQAKTVLQVFAAVNVALAFSYSF